MYYFKLIIFGSTCESCCQCCKHSESPDIQDVIFWKHHYFESNVTYRNENPYFIFT